MDREVEISLNVNGSNISKRIPVRRSLVDFLRDDLGLTGSHVGCEHGVCGMCTVRFEGRIARGCLLLAVQADGATIETIEGLTETGEIADLQAAFVERNAAMRVLYSRHAGNCSRAAKRASDDIARGNSAFHLGKLLPVHRLSGHRGRD
jgi:aerobic-type carbon monoxide dehydrogenase small subunit (CoxS/CutS family)